MDNNRDLLAQYEGQWIAVEGESIVAADRDEFEADRRAREAGVEIPFVVYVRPHDAPPIVIGPILLE
jgi:hypothetical protein